MKRNVTFLCLGVALLVLAASCTSFQISGIEVPQTRTEGQVVGNFDIKVNITKFAGISAGSNLVNLTSYATDPKIVDAIRNEVGKLGGTAAVNVKIEYQSSFFNGLLNGITIGLYAPSTAHVTGTVIK
jgi:hypothetical protein